jgi:polysaccharide biosynthesis transport protein
MLNSTGNRTRAGAAQGAPDPLLELFNPSELVTIVKRQWPLIAAVAGLVMLLAFAYLATAQPRYTATTSILIDTRKNQMFQNQLVVGELQIDASGVESQVEILKSESVALAVIRKLKLTEDEVFMAGARGRLGSLIGQLSGGADAHSEFQKERVAMALFERSLAAKRLGLTYAIEVAFTSISPDKAAEIANAIGDAYMVGELDSKYQATKRASRWLQERISELGEQASAADSAVQKFKAENNIIDTGRGMLMSDQQLSDVNTQLIAARAATAEAKARLDRIQQVASGDVPDASMVDALRSEVITRLRSQFLDLSTREADWSSRYGRNHLAAVNIRNQMAEIRRSIGEELKRIAQTVQSDFEIARAREASLQASLENLVTQSTTTSQAQVRLRDLESSAQSLRNLYDSFLQRFMEATQQQTFAISEARVITAATPPIQPSAPKSRIILLLGMAGGLVAGFSAALVREKLDTNFRSIAETESLTGLECLGIVPTVAETQALDIRAEDAQNRVIRGDVGIYRHVSEAPFSRFAETLRNIKVAVDINSLSSRLRVIGIVSALPKEGKTTISANFAHLIAQSGRKVVLVDGDMRNPALSRRLLPNLKAGLIDVLMGRENLNDVIWRDPVTGVHVLPTVTNGRIARTSDLLSSQAMAELLIELKDRYDYVIVDLPPLLPVVDVKAAQHLIDGFVLVVEWGRTTKEAVQEAVASVDGISKRGIGVVLNRANPAMLKRFEGYKGRYYDSYYLDYGSKQPSA